MFKNLDAIISKWSKGEKIVAALFIPILIFLVAWALTAWMGRDWLVYCSVITIVLTFILEMRIFKHF
ncbi:hypothetical protein D0T87_16320 [Bacteroides sp. 51]|nr:hypothetical protein [Bacteroides sp. 51]